ncbi:hypothetical protein BJD99_19895 [Rhodococcus sp. 1163]|uniref:hypothetical protein n=1 Tax=Rhodococcus sp. 1163 TaxID=1905289 RepID=UPI0009FC3771|nr:hypothetical protein [Rhodococcus sp. 1163]ORI18975.1 hypothetical protein BJD99_19895 [Rhodococcus sp. 1163]
MWPNDWPATPRAIATSTEEALAAARARSEDAYRDAVADVESEDAAQVGLVHAEIIRALLEELHPDGLIGDDVQDVLARTVRSASEWFGDLDVDGFVEVLTGALGVADTEAVRPRPRAGHALLIIAELSSPTRRAADGQGAHASTSSEVYIRRAIEEIARSQTIEMP